MNKTIYVTGITGFIGKNLLPNLLSSYDQVLNFTRQGTIQIINSDDIEEAKITKEFFCNNPSNLLINLATLYQQFPSNQDELNTLIDSLNSKLSTSVKKSEDLQIVINDLNDIVDKMTLSINDPDNGYLKQIATLELKYNELVKKKLLFLEAFLV